MTRENVAFYRVVAWLLAMQGCGFVGYSVAIGSTLLGIVALVVAVLSVIWHEVYVEMTIIQAKRDVLREVYRPWEVQGAKNDRDLHTR